MLPLQDVNLFSQPSLAKQSDGNLFQLLSNRINLKSYHPCLSLSSYRKIHSFHEQVLQLSGSRMCPSPKYHIGVCPTLNWIILVISLDSNIRIAFVDLKSHNLIKIVNLGYGEARFVGFPQDESGDSCIGNDIYILYTNLLVGTLNIVKMDEGNHVIMISNDSGYVFHSCQDGSEIKSNFTLEKLPLINQIIFQDGATLLESDKIVSITNQYELCWIDLKSWKITHKVELECQPSRSVSIKIDQFSRRIILCEPNGIFISVNCNGETEKTFEAPKNEKCPFENGIPHFHRMPSQFLCFPTIYQKTGEIFYCDNYLLTQIR